MVYFGEVAEGKGLPEIPGIPKPQEIKPEGTMTKDSALDFIKGLFSDVKLGRYELDEDEAMEEAFDWSVDDFDFSDFKIDDEMRQAIDRFAPSRWREMPQKEREEAIYQLADCISRGLGLREKPTVGFFSGSASEWGGYYTGRNYLEINRNNLDDSIETMDTVAHELRHAYQDQRADLCETRMDALYAYNFDNYITPTALPGGGYKHFNEYQNQLVEAEARAFANHITGRRTR